QRAPRKGGAKPFGGDERAPVASNAAKRAADRYPEISRHALAPNKKTAVRRLRTDSHRSDHAVGVISLAGGFGEPHPHPAQPNGSRRAASTDVGTTARGRKTRNPCRDLIRPSGRRNAVSPYVTLTQ